MEKAGVVPMYPLEEVQHRQHAFSTHYASISLALSLALLAEESAYHREVGTMERLRKGYGPEVTAISSLKTSVLNAACSSSSCRFPAV